MAINFPTPATVGETFTDTVTGITFTWNGYGWTQGGTSTGGGTPVDAYTKAESDAKYVELTGDTMSGDLTIDAASLVVANGGTVLVAGTTPAIWISNTGGRSFLIGQTDGLSKWDMEFANNTTSDFKINAYDDAGVLKSTPLSISRATGATMLTGNLTIAPPTGTAVLSVLSSDVDGAITLSKGGSGKSCQINGYNGGNHRWQISLGNTNPETGGNSGSDFAIGSSDDAGVSLSTPLIINRATGVADFAVTPTVLGVPIGGGGGGGLDQATADGLYVNVTGDTMTGQLTFAHTSGVGAGAYYNSMTVPNKYFIGADIASENLIFSNSAVGNVMNISGSSGKISMMTQLQVWGSGIGVGGAYPGASWSAWNTSIDGMLHSFYAASSGGIMVGNISVNASTTTYNTTSDVNLKEDLKSFDAGNIIDQTNVYDFAWKSTGERAYGIVAQEAVEVYPNAITHIDAFTPEDPEEPAQAEWWGVDYSKYVPVILQELKRLRERVRELETGGTISPKA